jgi:hypothetical protein
MNVNFQRVKRRLRYWLRHRERHELLQARILIRTLGFRQSADRDNNAGASHHPPVCQESSRRAVGNPAAPPSRRR